MKSLRCIRDLDSSQFKQREQDEYLGRATDVIVDIDAEEEARTLSEMVVRSEYPDYSSRPFRAAIPEIIEDYCPWNEPTSSLGSSLLTISDETASVDHGIIFDWGTVSDPAPGSFIIGGYEQSTSYSSFLCTLGHSVRGE